MSFLLQSSYTVYLARLQSSTRKPQQFQYLKLVFLKIPNTINREIFVYENIHVLNIRVNKFSRVPHENILTRKFVKLKLLCTYCRLSDY